MQAVQRSRVSQLIRLSNDAWALVLFIVMFSFLQYAITRLKDAQELLHHCLTMTLITILIISFFSNPQRELSRFVTANIMFIAFFISLITIAVDWNIILLLVGFFALLWIYFIMCMQFPELSEYELNLTHLFVFAVVQLALYSLFAVFLIGLPSL